MISTTANTLRALLPLVLVITVALATTIYIFSHIALSEYDLQSCLLNSDGKTTEPRIHQLGISAWLEILLSVPVSQYFPVGLEYPFGLYVSLLWLAFLIPFVPFAIEAWRQRRTPIAFVAVIFALVLWLGVAWILGYPAISHDCEGARGIGATLFLGIPLLSTPPALCAWVVLRLLKRRYARRQTV